MNKAYEKFMIWLGAREPTPEEKRDGCIDLFIFLILTVLLILVCVAGIFIGSWRNSSSEQRIVRTSYHISLTEGCTVEICSDPLPGILDHADEICASTPCSFSHPTPNLINTSTMTSTPKIEVAQTAAPFLPFDCCTATIVGGILVLPPIVMSLFFLYRNVKGLQKTVVDEVKKPVRELFTQVSELAGTIKELQADIEMFKSKFRDRH